MEKSGQAGLKAADPPSRRALRRDKGRQLSHAEAQRAQRVKSLCCIVERTMRHGDSPTSESGRREMDGMKGRAEASGPFGIGGLEVLEEAR